MSTICYGCLAESLDVREIYERSADNVLKQAMENVYISCVQSITDPAYTYVSVDVFIDNDGYNNTVCTGSTTSTYCSANCWYANYACYMPLVCECMTCAKGGNGAYYVTLYCWGSFVCASGWCSYANSMHCFQCNNYCLSCFSNVYIEIGDIGGGGLYDGCGNQCEYADVCWCYPPFQNDFCFVTCSMTSPGPKPSSRSIPACYDCLCFCRCATGCWCYIKNGAFQCYVDCIDICPFLCSAVSTHGSHSDDIAYWTCNMIYIYGCCPANTLICINKKLYEGAVCSIYLNYFGSMGAGGDLNFDVLNAADAVIGCCLSPKVTNYLATCCNCISLRIHQCDAISILCGYGVEVGFV
jgi:hypothetical protein